MDKKFTPLVDEHLSAIGNMQEAETDPYFYTRLRARMEKKYSRQGISIRQRPSWMIATLVLLLLLNGYMFIQQIKTSSAHPSAAPTLQNFAESYDQVITSAY